MIVKTEQSTSISRLPGQVIDADDFFKNTMFRSLSHLTTTLSYTREADVMACVVQRFPEYG